MNTITSTTEKSKSNSLIFKTNKVVGRKDITVTIRLNDECKNGHQDFAITADIYEAGKPKTDRYFISGGCCHDDIAKAFPEFIPFIKLHLCDYEGIPMYAVENGFYHLRNGFNNTRPEDSDFKAEFCEYYRITKDQFDILNASKNKLQYALHLDRLGILAQWREEANKAIEQLEQLTGKSFLVDSVKTQYHAPTPEQIQAEQEKEESGYYTPEAEAQRAKQEESKIIAKLEAERNKEIKKANTEFEVKRQVLIIGGKKALDNCIFYSHSNTVAFNWRGYDQISEELIKTIADQIILPEGVKIETKSKS